MRVKTIIGLALLLLVLPALLVAFVFVKPPKIGLDFERVAFSDLPGWYSSDVWSARPALLKSCEKLATLPDNRRLPGAEIGGIVADWRDGCSAIQGARTADSLREALALFFQPLEVSIEGETEGLFTGYYEALLRGSPTRSERFNTPLYARPPELVMVDLGQFRDDLKGRRVAGVVDDGRLLPYPNRAAIENGALKGRSLEVLWVDSPVDAYFLHVQGSGRAQMPDGSFLGIGYAAQNGHANQLIGRYLIDTGEIPREKMSGQAIREWLAAHPEKVQSVLNTDPSFVFFRKLANGNGPYGSANVTLTPGHSIAVDRSHLPLHAPVWLSASHPDPAASDAEAIPFNRLMVAQDTGGAISGEIRGDVFWGFGKDAEEVAGRMANPGRYWLILPKVLAARAVGEGL